MTKKAKVLKEYKENWYISREDMNYLIKIWVVNWIWWKWSLLLKYVNTIKTIPEFNESRFWEWISDFEDIPVAYHDIDYTIGWWYWDFTLANFKLAVRTKRLLNWTNMFWKNAIPVMIFISTQLFGTKYFNFK